MVDDPNTDELIRWSPAGDTFLGMFSKLIQSPTTFVLETKYCHGFLSTTILAHLYDN